MKPRIGIILLVVVAVILLVAVVRAVGSSRVEIIQPISYNHNLHVEDQGLECRDCHRYAEESPKATLPSLSVCLDCHDTNPMNEDSVEEAKLIQYIQDGSEIPWQQVYEVPDHVYFSHRRHVVAGDLDCMICHGDVGALTEPVTTLFFSLSMEACMDCHRESQASNDCLACHR